MTRAFGWFVLVYLGFIAGAMYVETFGGRIGCSILYDATHLFYLEKNR